MDVDAGTDETGRRERPVDACYAEMEPDFTGVYGRVPRTSHGWSGREELCSLYPAYE